MSITTLLDTIEHALEYAKKSKPYTIADPGTIITHLLDANFLDEHSWTVEPKGFDLSLLTPEFYTKLRELESVHMNNGSGFRDMLHAGFLYILDYELDCKNGMLADRAEANEIPFIPAECAVLFDAVDGYLNSVKCLEQAHGNFMSAHEEDSFEHVQTTDIVVRLMSSQTDFDFERYTYRTIQRLLDKVQHFNQNRRSSSSLVDVVADNHYLKVLALVETMMASSDTYTSREFVPILRNTVQNWNRYSPEQQQNIYARIVYLSASNISEAGLYAHLDYFRNGAPAEFQALCDRTLLSYRLGMNIKDATTIETNLCAHNVSCETLPFTL